MDENVIYENIPTFYPTPATLGINEWCRKCHQDALDAGWQDGVDTDSPLWQATVMALIHSEVSEALEGIRKGTMDDHLPHRPTVEVELADAMIRIFHFCGARGLDLEGAVQEKREYNLHRPDHKPEARAAAGGKKF